MKVAIQGIKGCFHEIAAYKYFGEHEVFNTLECDSFHTFFRQFQKSEQFYGVMAIENTIAGTILPNYALLRNSNLVVIGEVYLRIQHNLLGLNGQHLEEIREVHSHPMALLQCHQFFKENPHIRMVESQDTAFSAKKVSEKKCKHTAAIASTLAADYYNLEILAEGIETNKKNFTRFLVLQDKEVVKPTQYLPNKSSICFKLAHEIGSLAKVLSILAEKQINLTKIQSLPVLGRSWQYFFHVDLTFSDYDVYRKALENIQEHIGDLKILGEYRTGLKFRTI